MYNSHRHFKVLSRVLSSSKISRRSAQISSFCTDEIQHEIIEQCVESRLKGYKEGTDNTS